MIKATILNKFVLQLFVIDISIAEHTLQQLQVIKSFEEIPTIIDGDNFVPVISPENGFANQVGIKRVVRNV
jgi:vacuolar-type H+-ATPase subunit C/Vma6